MGEESKIRDVVDAVAGVAKAVPIYQDVAQPAAQEIGRALHTVAKSVHLALAPVSALIWGYDQVKDFVATKVAERLKDVAPGNIVTPKPNVAGPALEALKYTGHEEALSDMYANLLASAMDKNSAAGAHPAFVEIIRQLTPDEAKIVSLFPIPQPYPLVDVSAVYKNPTAEKSGGYLVRRSYSNIAAMAGCEFPDLFPSYLDNLCRLGLAEVPALFRYTGPGVYEPLENSDEIREVVESVGKDPERYAQIDRKGMRITSLGMQFARVCVMQRVVWVEPLPKQ